jgi:Fic family protein
MDRGIQGQYVITTAVPERCHAFVPWPLPPGKAVEKDDLLYERALLALGRLDSMTTLLPDPGLFLYLYVRKEAILSSQIEGTQSSLSDLLLYEASEVPGVPMDDVQEVSRYVAALNHGLLRIRKDGMPLCNRLIREIHSVLLAEGRGSEKAPGEFRKSQNWIGGTLPTNAEYVPPPPDQVEPCMGELEKFLNDEYGKLSTLIKAALAHVQFETVHPFLDGNGRLGRLLITFILCSEGALSEPLLYLSLYFKTHRRRYYDLLQQVRLKGDWETWLNFFLEGVAVTSEQATQAAHRIIRLFDQDRAAIGTLGRATGNVLRVHELLQKKPLISVPFAVKELALTSPTITAAINHMQKLGIVREVTGKQRGRLFVYDEYLKILEEGTKPALL